VQQIPGRDGARPLPFRSLAELAKCMLGADARTGSSPDGPSHLPIFMSQAGRLHRGLNSLKRNLFPQGFFACATTRENK